MNRISVDDVRAARERLRLVIGRTQLSLSQGASHRCNAPIYLKFENEQRTGSFKIRGAYNKISQLPTEDREKGIIAASAGNHAQGVAQSASLLSVKSTIVMPETSPIVKIKATQGYGANVILFGENYDEAYARGRELADTEKKTFVHPFEDPHIIAGQGTVGLEILEEEPEVDTIIVPVGGGGLISGIALAVKTLNLNCRIIGVQSSRSPGMCLKKKPELKLTVDPLEPPTIADGIAVKKPSEAIYDLYIRSLVDDIVTVTDDEIAEAIVFLLERAKTVVEGSGAVGLAAAFNHRIPLGKKNVVVLSGGNIDLNLISKIIEKGLMKRGRLSRVTVLVKDQPGYLNLLTGILAKQKANILDVTHDRLHREVGLRETRIEFLVETQSEDHILEIKRKISEAGGKII